VRWEDGWNVGAKEFFNREDWALYGQGNEKGLTLISHVGMASEFEGVSFIKYASGHWFKRGLSAVYVVGFHANDYYEKWREGRRQSDAGFS